MSKRIKFTKAALSALPIPAQGKRETYYDKERPKLALRITGAGTRTFYVIKRLDSEMIWIKLGTFPGMTPEQAGAEADKVLGVFAAGTNPALAKRALKGEHTLGQLFEEYLERHAIPHGRKTIEDMRANFRRYLGQWQDRKLSTITKTDVQKLHGKLGREIGAHTGNRTLELLRAILNKGIEWGYVKKNPALGITKFKLHSRERFLFPQEIPMFFRAVGEESNDVIRDYLLLSILTGARQANVLSMRWEQIEFDRAEWRIPETKNGEPQTVTLSPEALDILRRRKREADAGYVFTGTGKHGHLLNPKKGWTRVLERTELYRLVEVVGEIEHMTREEITKASKPESLSAALLDYRERAKAHGIEPGTLGIQDLRIHDLRRTLGSWQARTGASLAIIGKSLGHKNMATTLVYARLDLDPVRASVNMATAAMMEAAGLKQAAEVTQIKSKTAA